MSDLEIRSDAFDPDRPIPRKYTADGLNVSPPLRWQAAPPGTREFALIVDDPDAPQDEPWVHWLIYRITADVTRLPEGIPPSQRIFEPGGAVQGRNSWGRIGYGGPQPPRGHGVHRYHFKLYALDAALAPTPGLDKAELLGALEGHVIARAEYIGTYER